MTRPSDRSRSDTGQPDTAILLPVRQRALSAPPGRLEPVTSQSANADETAEAAQHPRRAARQARPMSPATSTRRAQATSERPPAPDETRWQRIRRSFWFQTLVTFAVMGLILSFIAKPYYVPSGSMEETLMPGDRVLVNRLDTTPDRGEVFVFDADESWQILEEPPRDALIELMRWIGRVSGFGPSGEHTMIKRVIGLPGETVECCDADGSILIDDKPIEEPYLGSNFDFTAGTLDCDTQPRSQRCFSAIVVPDNSYLVLGDNRAVSSDSARYCRASGATPSCWRWASKESLVGKAVVVLWPISRWSGL